MLFLFYSCCFLPFIVFHSIETVWARPSFGCMFFPFGRYEQASNTWTQLFRSFSMSPFRLQSLHRSWHLLGRMDFQYNSGYIENNNNKNTRFFFSYSLPNFFFSSFLSTFITLACVLFRWAVSVSHHYLEMCFQMKQYDSSRFSIHLVNQWSEFTGCLCQQSPSGKLWIQAFSIKTANHHFWKMCVQDVLTMKTRWKEWKR